MSGGKHTPGPWHVSGKATINHPVRGWIASVSPVDRAANARLIAAAPELLEALERVSRWQGKLSYDDWEQVDAAIAKARGEA